MTIETAIDTATLPTRRFGRTDMNITRVGFGAWAIGGADWAVGWGAQDDSDSVAAIRHAVARGINWIDTAAVYGLGHSEEVVGKALAEIPAAERPYVFTKCGQVWDERDRTASSRRVGAPASIRRELEASLRRLGVERIDLYQMHWPAEDGTPLEAYWQTLLDLKAEGKVRAVGLSNHNVAQLEAAEALGHVDTLQPPFSAIRRGVAEAELPWCHAHETGVIVYSPMQSGLLTGRFSAERASGPAAGRLALAQPAVPGGEARRQPEARRGPETCRGAARHQRCGGRGGVDAGMARGDRRHRRRPQSGAGRRLARCGNAGADGQRPRCDRRGDRGNRSRSRPGFAAELGERRPDPRLRALASPCVPCLLAYARRSRLAAGKRWKLVSAPSMVLSAQTEVADKEDANDPSCGDGWQWQGRPRLRGGSARARL